MNHFVKILFLSFLLLSLISCNEQRDENHNRYNHGGGGSIPTSDQFNKYLNEKLTSDQKCQLETDHTNHPLPYPVITPLGNKKWNEGWSKNIFNDLEESELNSLMNVALKNDELRAINCPKFNSMNTKNKKMFWTIFMASVSSAESAFKTNEFYKEKGTNDSYGLLQIDAPNSRAHGCTLRNGRKPSGGTKGKSAGGDMYDPDANLRCGMFILKNQVRKTGSLFARNSYWAVLRTSRPGHSRFKNFFKAHIQQVKACRGEGETDSANQCLAINDSQRNVHSNDQRLAIANSSDSGNAQNR